MQVVSLLVSTVSLLALVSPAIPAIRKGIKKIHNLQMKMDLPLMSIHPEVNKEADYFK